MMLIRVRAGFPMVFSALAKVDIWIYPVGAAAFLLCSYHARAKAAANKKSTFMRVFMSPFASLVECFRPSRAEPVLNKVRAASGLSPVVEPDIPQAGIVEENLEAYSAQDWRKHFSDQLQGKGLEIGPLHRPLVRHPGMDVEYIDRYTVADLRAHYPELEGFPLVEPHIIGDAETLSNVPDGKYDFLVSAHVIEHMRNPLGSLEQWCRVLKPGGLLYLIVPDKRVTFDKQRVRTTLEHMIFDYLQPSIERDKEHFLDYAVQVNKKRGNEAIAEMKRLLDIDYSIHFHVFLPSDIVNLLSWFTDNIRPLEILEGPCLAPGSDEFHLLLRCPERPAQHN
jgi:SAM-dependent methyltransferase